MVANLPTVYLPHSGRMGAIVGITESVLGRWWAVVDGMAEGEPADLLADNVEFSLTFAATTRTGGRAELLAYVAERVSAGRRHHIRLACVAGTVEIVVGELLEHGTPIATFVGTAECDAAGRMTRYLITSSPDIRLSLPSPAPA
jgi:hypothetical protein